MHKFRFGQHPPLSTWWWCLARLSQHWKPGLECSS